jgi:hypothetical protein
MNRLLAAAMVVVTLTGCAVEKECNVSEKDCVALWYMMLEKNARR